MNRYEVEVLVKYRVDAHSETEAFEKISDGAEFPVLPYDDNTYCHSISVVDVTTLSLYVETKEE
jgi:hypothetical protein